MKNEDLKTFITGLINDRETLCKEHGDSINTIKDDIQDIKIELAKIVTAYKVFIAIGSAVGVLIGFLTELFIRST